MIETDTMLIHTVNFGDLEVTEEKVVHFKEGVPGFPNIHRFAVLEYEDLKPFHYLQALDDPPIALLVLNPFVVDPEYKFQLSNSDMEDIQTTRTDDVAVYAVATIPDNPEQATINLMAPIVINDRKRCGKQVVLHDSGYSVKHPLFKASNVNEKKAGG
jgi:flagellar assembly factor FliW